MLKGNNMKKAFLVDISICTRVVVETDGLTDEQIKDVAATTGLEKVKNDPYGYIAEDNISEVNEDTVMPYDPKGIDKEEN